MSEPTLTPIKYVGLQPKWSDHLYDTGLSFDKDKSQSVPVWAARLFLRHPEFKDMRPNFARHMPLVGQERPVVEVIEDEVLVDRIPLENMSVLQLQSFTMKNWGVRLEPEMPREDMIGEARGLMGQRRGA